MELEPIGDIQALEKPEPVPEVAPPASSEGTDSPAISNESFTGGSSNSGSGGSSSGAKAPPAPAPQPEQPAAPAPAPAPPACPSSPGGSGSAPGVSSGQGVAGTTSSDISSFAARYNAIRAENCLEPVASGNFRYDSCMEQRLFWMAEDPSTDPMSAWGHMGSQRSDGVPSVGCDGNLAGGSNNDGATVAQKWWDSSAHRASLYRPGTSTAGVCIYFAMTHGGIPNESSSFARSAARWGSC